jgi:hypothetical protein
MEHINPILKDTKELILTMLEESDTLDYGVAHSTPKGKGDCGIIARIGERVIFGITMKVADDSYVEGRIYRGSNKDVYVHSSRFWGEGEAKDTFLKAITELVEEADNGHIKATSHRVHFLVTVDVEPNEKMTEQTDKEMAAEMQQRLDDEFRYNVNMHTANVVGSYRGLSVHAIDAEPPTE